MGLEVSNLCLVNKKRYREGKEDYTFYVSIYV